MYNDIFVACGPSHNLITNTTHNIYFSLVFAQPHIHIPFQYSQQSLLNKVNLSRVKTSHIYVTTRKKIYPSW